MFNALNRFISRLDSDVSAQSSATYGGYGFQVLRNNNTELPIEPWFDFIIGINGRMIVSSFCDLESTLLTGNQEDADPNLFTQEIRNCAGGTVSLGVWSAKGQRIRTIHAIVPPAPDTLGLTLQHSSLSAVSTIWHILDVPPNSPADLAGLLPYSDYILGTPEGVLHGEAGLGELVEDHIGRPLKLYVYNNEYDVTREITIQPSRDWGGEGALGCTLGFGALHRLPAPLSEPVAGPGETLFSTELDGEVARFSNEEPRPGSGMANNFFVPAAAPIESGDFLVPAQMSTPPPAPLATPTARRERKHIKATGKGLDIDDYFNEGEKKSREQDHAPSTKKSPAPPPPKAGSGAPMAGPPKAVKVETAESAVPEKTTEDDLSVLEQN